MSVERFSIAEKQRTNQSQLSWVGMSSLARATRDGSRAQRFRRGSEQARFAVSRRQLRQNAAGEGEYLSDAEVEDTRARAAEDVQNWCE